MSNRIFFTGIPGSKWNAVAQTLENLPGFNTTDRSANRDFSNGAHKGAYFGRGMEFPAELDLSIIDSAWAEPNAGIKVVKSHDWAYMLDELYTFTRNTGDQIMLVQRDVDASFNWWDETGGFLISYPDHSAYVDNKTMRNEMIKQNNAIIEFGKAHSLVFEHLSHEWLNNKFGLTTDVPDNLNDVFVALI